jgi:hypothetical protein
MKNKGIVFFLIILAAVIVLMIVADYRADRPGKSKANPFALDMDDYRNVDPSLILFKETKNFRIGFENPAAMVIHNDRIFVAGDNRLKIIDLNGRLLNEFNIPSGVQVMNVYDGNIFVAAGNRILVLDEQGNVKGEWEPMEANSLLTGIASTKNDVFLADAGNRRVMRYSHAGERLGSFDGKADDGVLHGFIIPSPTFDLAVNNDEELWVVNPGMHALENYTFDGKLRGYWKKSGVNPEGFSGCCNPSYFTFLSDGRFITSEKGLVRVKVYKPSGELEGVVAAPVKFADEGKAPGVAADSRNNVYLLDFDRKIIRVFEPN